MSEIERLRRAQAKAVMPLIGGLLDQWEGLDNDSKSSLRWDCPTLCSYLDKISAAMEGDQSPQATETPAQPYSSRPTTE